ncbi:ATP-binding protein [Streptomyces sp. NBC_01803]|uniref:ATP-binding protein n=1 Tax=Streptomyces sp. NBC_01803 TaxID=2975946 RepID=UPI002DD82733|nr:ATP-binding protein [Streptomyces sp. NBC_01803]WSA45746.1 ATP-binding protein [Streptomyces sp. NBC_01803]
MGIARLQTQSVLVSWGVGPSKINDARLVTSELIADAVRESYASEQPPTYAELAAIATLTLTLRPVSLGVAIEVFDRNPNRRRPASPENTPKSKYGRLLLNGLSTDWGAVHVVEKKRYVGQMVWALVNCRAMWNQ